MTRISGLLLLWLAIGIAKAAPGDSEIEVDFSRLSKPYRLLHGINRGPLGAGGLMDLTAEHRAGFRDAAEFLFAH
jgi:hypothetical protein